MMDLLQMLCALPAPCGNEGIVKKYITMKYPMVTEDAFGNLVYKTKGDGPLTMLYVSLDEDAFLAMEGSGNKMYFSQLGRHRLYPSMTVSFGGYTGVFCEEGNQKYLYMADGADSVAPGRAGVADGEFEGETDKDENLLLGKNIANRAAIAALLTADIQNENICVVFGVKSNHSTTGLAAAVELLKPAKTLIFEETRNENFAVKIVGEGFGASEDMALRLEAALQKADVSYVRTADNTEKTLGGKAPWNTTAVLGIPILFADYMRQGIRVKTVKALKKIVQAYLEE